MSFFDGMKDWVTNIKDQIDKLDRELSCEEDGCVWEPAVGQEG